MGRYNSKRDEFLTEDAIPLRPVDYDESDSSTISDSDMERHHQQTQDDRSPRWTQSYPQRDDRNRVLHPSVQVPYTMPPSPFYAPLRPPQWQQALYDVSHHQPANQYMGADEKPNRAAPENPQWNDVLFGILFWTQFFGFVALSVVSFRRLAGSTFAAEVQGEDQDLLPLNLASIYLLGSIAGAALVFSCLLLVLVSAFTRFILELTLVLGVLVLISATVYFWVTKLYIAAILLTVVSIISVLAFFSMRKRIPLSTAILKFVIKVSKTYPSVYVIAIVGAVLQSIYTACWSFSTIAVYRAFFFPDLSTSQQASTAVKITLLVFAAFSYFWTSQLIINYFLTVEAGIFATYYFSAPGSPSTVGGSFKRASTTSFGSIAFGALIVALVDLLRAAMQMIMQHEAGQGDLLGCIIACIATACMDCVASLVEYFNRYAMIEIAIYGFPFIKAAKSTWNLFKDRGIDALVNDCLVDNIWIFGSLVVGLLCSGLTYLYFLMFNLKTLNITGQTAEITFIVYAFVIGFFISYTLGFGALSSGVSTIFVGLGEDPGAMARLEPDLYQTIVKAYPEVGHPVRTTRQEV